MDIKIKDDNINMLVEQCSNEINNVNDKTNDINDTNKILQLEKVQEKIEKMNTFHQIEILKILYNHKNEVTLNENKNGTLINLTDVPDYIIDKLYKYISYVENQERQLNNVETEKDTILNNYFN
jgi:hypothetical protein